MNSTSALHSKRNTSITRMHRRPSTRNLEKKLQLVLEISSPTAASRRRSSHYDRNNRKSFSQKNLRNDHYESPEYNTSYDRRKNLDSVFNDDVRFQRTDGLFVIGDLHCQRKASFVDGIIRRTSSFVTGNNSL